MANLKEQLRNMTPEQTELFLKFKSVATAKTPEEKNKAFINFLGFIKKKKGGANGQPTAGNINLGTR